MCGRTSLYIAPEELEDRFDATIAFDYEPRYNISPRQNLATIRNTDGDNIVEQEWGLLPSWADDPAADGPRPINARSETVAETPMFREAFAERRCLVLADGFYEWQGARGSKQPYRIHLTDNEPFAMAGLWNRWTANGESMETVTILTTDPNDVLEPIHDRMPVVLPVDAEVRWLDAEPKTAQSLCVPYPGDDMEAYAVSTAVNNPGNDRPEVVTPAETEQSGIDEF